MICPRCLQRAAVRRSGPVQTATRWWQANAATPSSQRSLSSSSASQQQSISVTAANQAKPRQPPLPSSPGSHQPPSATSTSAAQPFSTPLTPSPAAEGIFTPKKPATPPVKISSVPAGTVLKGLNYMKNKQDPVAGADEEYPAWLWSCLDSATKKGKDAGAAAEGDLFSKSKKQRRLAAKRLRKQALLDPGSLTPKVPLEEQSIDLPSGTTEGLKAREELTEALRRKRRAAIKEDNFLRSMR